MRTAAASMPARTAGRLGSWLSVRHSLRAEAVLILVLYGVYEAARGLLDGDTREGVRHARDILARERSTGMLVDERVQDATHALPGLVDLLGIAPLGVQARPMLVRA